MDKKQVRIGDREKDGNYSGLLAACGGSARARE